MRVKVFENFRPEAAIVNCCNERHRDTVQGGDLFFELIKPRFCDPHGIDLLLKGPRSLLRYLGGSRVVNRPTKQSQNEASRRHNEKWPAPV